MRVDEYRATLLDTQPPPHLSLALQALWWDAKGDWERAHECVQVNEAELTSAWVHAYLHRKEGDRSNAAYWYRRASKAMPPDAFEAEWLSIVASLLEGTDASP